MYQAGKVQNIYFIAKAMLVLMLNEVQITFPHFASHFNELIDSTKQCNAPPHPLSGRAGILVKISSFRKNFCDSMQWERIRCMTRQTDIEYELKVRPLQWEPIPIFDECTNALPVCGPWEEREQLHRP